MYFSVGQFKHGHLGYVIVLELRVLHITRRPQAEISYVISLSVIYAEDEVPADGVIHSEISSYSAIARNVLILTLKQLYNAN